MTGAMVRQALRAYLGEARYRRLVEQGSRRGRLRYWQEREWQRFMAAHPEFAAGLDVLEAALNVCHLHGDELRPDTVPLLQGCIDPAPGFVETSRRLFPNAALGTVSTEGRAVDADRAEVRYCPSCRQVAAEWRPRQASRPGLPGRLTRRTSLDELAELWGASQFEGQGLDKWTSFVREVGFCLVDGGELWEWETEGLREFAGAYGVAVIRGDEWARSWTIGRS